MKIDINELVKIYDEEYIINGLNLEIDKVEAVVILGKSGSGKSTLLRLMSGIESFDKGSININNQKVNTDEYKNNIGFVFQSGSLFPHLTVYDNILLVLEKIKKIDKKEAKIKINNLLDKFSLIEHKDKYPYMLSGGQQQRASIVRSLAVEAEILYFDEPTSALDPILTNEVLSMIKELRVIGKKFFIVTHEVGFAKKVADYVLFLKDGKIEEQGNVSILDNPKSKALKEFLSLVLI